MAGSSGEGKRGYLRISMDIEELFLAVNEDSYIFSLAKLSPHNERCQGLGFLGEDSAKMHVRTQTGHIVPPPPCQKGKGTLLTASAGFGDKLLLLPCKPDEPVFQGPGAHGSQG